MFSNERELFNKEDLNVRVSVYGKNPKYYMTEAYKDAWLKRICEVLDETDNVFPASYEKYTIFEPGEGEFYAFKDCTRYDIKAFDNDTLVFTTTLWNVKGDELISFIKEQFKWPRTLRIDCDYCSWVILIPNQQV